MCVVGIIPARLESYRLPGKLLLSGTGKPLIQHTWERACQAKTLDAVLIATDSEVIDEACRRFGADVVLTRKHSSGTDRVAEVVRDLITMPDVVINIQGDEPEIDHLHIDLLVDLLRNNPQADMSTLASVFSVGVEADEKSCVKVVCTDDASRALYFSRHPLSGAYRHIGVYGYRSDFLVKLASKSQTRLEELESLEQLRALDMGAHIAVGLVGEAAVGVDVVADYIAFVRRFNANER